MFKKFFLGALIALSIFGNFSISEAHHGYHGYHGDDYGYCGGCCR